MLIIITQYMTLPLNPAKPACTDLLGQQGLQSRGGMITDVIVYGLELLDVAPRLPKDVAVGPLNLKFQESSLAS